MAGIEYHGVPQRPFRRELALPRKRDRVVPGAVNVDLAHVPEALGAQAQRLSGRGGRLRHQADQVRAGAPPDDFVDPKTLGPVTRRGLKEAFGVISRSQRALAAELGLRMP